MSQTSYSTRPVKAQPGMSGGNNEGEVNLSLAYEGTAPLGFGLAVVAGTDPELQVQLPSAAAQLFRGVSSHQHPLEDETLAGSGGFNDAETLSVKSRGLVWCVAAEVMAVGDSVFFIHTGGSEGQFRNDADGGNADQVTAASVEGYDADSGLVLLNLNLP